MIYTSEIDGIKIWHFFIRPKGPGVPGRIIDYLFFHLLSTVFGIFLINKADIILSNSPPLTVGVTAWVLSTLKRIPFIYEVQEIYPEIMVDTGVVKNRFIISLLSRLERFIYSKASMISVISNSFKENLVQKNVPSSKIEIIPNFVDKSMFGSESRDNDFSIENDLIDKFVVLFAGNMGLAQGIETIVEASEYLEQEKDIQIVLVGGGVKYKWLSNELKKKKLENVRLLSFQPHEMVPLLYASADVCLIPLAGRSAKSAMPSKIYEIMAAGKPALASTNEDSDLAQLIRAIGCGYVVKEDDARALSEAILRAYHEKEASKIMGRKGRAYVEENCSLDAATLSYSNLIRKTVRKEATSNP